MARRRGTVGLRRHDLSFMSEKTETNIVRSDSTNDERVEQLFEQHFVAELRPVAAAAERITGTDKRRDLDFAREMTADPRAHAFADQKRRAVGAESRACLGQGGAMRRNQLRWTIGTFPAFAHVIVIKGLDRAEFLQARFPALHPGMRRRCTGPGRKKEKWPSSLVQRDGHG